MNDHSITSRRTACIVCNGELHGSNRVMSLTAQADLLIAADGGAEYMNALGLKPHAIIGDMDSLLEDPWPDDESIRRVRLSSDKDKCDGELAVNWAFEQGCSKAMLLAACGGRIDQSLGNCALLMHYPGRLALWDDGILVMAITEGQDVMLTVPAGMTVSIISSQSDAIVHTDGLRYPLNNEPLRSATHGVSNVAVTSRPRVAVAKGTIFVCMEGGETWLEE